MGQLINLHVAALVVLSSLLFGLGQPSAVSPLLALVAAVLAYRYTDSQKRFHVGRLVVNGAILVIAMVTGWRLVQDHGTLEAIVIGQAVLAMQIVLLFEAKTVRSRWDLISLSLLMTFLSTSFVHGPSFGLVLGAFFFFALSTIALVFFERERRICEASQLQVGGNAAVETVADVTRTNWWRLAAVAFATLVVGPLSLFLRFPDLSRRDRPLGGQDSGANSSRWPLWGRHSVMNTLGSDAVEAAATGREFRWRMGRITGFSVALSLIVFFATPRFGRFELELPRLSEVIWEKPSNSRRRTVGYTDRVKLGELGAVTENRTMVLEVQFADHDTGVPFAARDGAYLRGSILTQYLDGHWNLVSYAPHAKLVYRTTDPLVRQKIAIEDLDEDDLFCVWPFVKIRDDRSVRFEARSERLHRSREMISRAFSYELGTTAFDNQVQVDMVPCTRPINRHTLLQWPERSLPSVARLASQWLEQARVPEDDPIGRAHVLERGLQLSEQFTYSLEGAPRIASVDPIEDFVTNHPQGNCEFFASALALMLRSQGIPSRLVVGYRARDFRKATKSYPVRQCDAHAWVEAYISPEHLVGHPLPDNHSDWSHGAWLRLEPTPTMSTEVYGVALLALQMRNAVEWLRFTWRARVLGMNRLQQRTFIYRPLTNVLKDMSDQLSNSEPGEGLPTRNLWSFNKSLLGIAWLACLTVALSAVLVRFRLRLFLERGRLRFGRAGRHAGDNGEVAVAFYRQLEDLLAGHGQARQSSQTQREFAQHAGEQIAAISGERSVAAWTMEVVDAYYCVRFGKCDLDRGQKAAIQQLLTKIRRAADGPRSYA